MAAQDERISRSLDRIGDKYDILERLNAGGLSAVYKARHRLLDEIRVIKVLRPNQQARVYLNENFLREARMASRLQHAHLVRSYDFAVDDDGFAHIILEYVPGLDLAELMKGCGPLQVAITIEIGRQALDVLGYLHRQGLVHRDISPGNFVLARGHTGAPDIKLIDFGIANAKSRDIRTMSEHLVRDDLPYAAPEQFIGSGEQNMDASSDLYSLGVMLYEMLTAQRPFNGPDSKRIVGSHLASPAIDFAVSDPDEKIPDHLRAVVVKSLAFRPWERYQMAEAFASELAQVQEAFPLPSDALENLQSTLDSNSIDLPNAPGASSRRRQIPVTTKQAVHDSQVVIASVEDLPQAHDSDGDSVSRCAEIIEMCLDVGKLEEAKARLRAASRRFGHGERFEQLVEKLETIDKQRLDAAEKVRGALFEIRSSNLQNAVKILRSAVQVDPFNDQARMLREISEIAVLKENEVIRHLEEIPRAVAEIESLLDSSEFEDASNTLAVAMKTFGETEVFVELKQRLTDERRRERQVFIQGHLAAAKRHCVDREFNQALIELRNASALAPGDPEVCAFLDHTVRQHAIATIREYIDNGNIAEARRALSIAEKLHKENEAFTELRSKLEQHTNADSSAGIQGFLATARLFLKLAEFGSALGELRMAGKIDPLSSEVRALTQEIMQRQTETTIETYLDCGRLADAGRALAVAERIHGKTSLLRELRKRLTAVEIDGGETAVASLIESARHLIEEGDDRSALRILRRAGALDPKNADIKALTKEAICRQMEDAIAGHLKLGALEEAERAITFGEKLFGESSSLNNLRDQLVDLI